MMNHSSNWSDSSLEHIQLNSTGLDGKLYYAIRDLLFDKRTHYNYLFSKIILCLFR